ncbi:uncharacterized protein LOC143855551 isoform X1 [Tasmannia lanceolata]|uniref:uncharacterized protein LOC143855551 isoform X1 n=1 Tax=Tasmannia lanceolata TaxID=3420 RepID=UPI0040648E26
MVQYLLEDEPEISAFEERNRQLSEDLDRARAEKATFDDTVARLREDLRTTIEGRSRAADKLAVARRTHAQELAEAREEWRGSVEFLRAAAVFSVDVEINAFAECRQRVQEVDPSFPLDRLMHEAEVDPPHVPVEATELVGEEVAALTDPVVPETSEGAQ